MLEYWISSSSAYIELEHLGGRVYYVLADEEIAVLEANS
jgi:hypothetical protein